MNITTMRFFLFLPLALFACLSLASCEGGAGENELATKNEYSVLQHFEYKFRQKDHAQPYIVEADALGSGHDVIGLPIKGRDEGYVWLIAKSEGIDSVIVLPEKTSFTVDESTMRALEKSVKMSPATAALIRKAINAR